MGRARWEQLEWHGDDRFTLDGVNFWLTTTQFDVPSTEDRFVFLKNRAFLRSFEPLFEKVKPDRLLEVGIFHGGGTAFYDRLLRPEKLVCVELAADAPMLRHYMRQHDGNAITLYCDVDQGDRARVADIVEREFPAARYRPRHRRRQPHVSSGQDELRGHLPVPSSRRRVR